MTTQTTPCPCNGKQRSIFVRLFFLLLTALVGAAVRHHLDTPRYDAIETKIENVDAKVDALGSMKALSGRATIKRPSQSIPSTPTGEEFTGDIIQEKLAGRRP